MLQFNSLRSRGNYANAGRAAADSALRLFIAARRSSPDYGQLAQKGAQLRAEEKKQMIQIKGELASRAIQVESQLKANRIEMDAELDAKKDSRKAGLLSAAGQLGGMGMMNYAEEKIKGRDSSKLIDRYNTQIQDLETKAGELRDGTTTISKDIDEINPGNQQGGAQPGKVTEVATTSVIPKVEPVTSISTSSNGWPRLRRVLSTGEGTQGEKGYTTRFGGGQFELGNDHPRLASKTPWGTESAAAGKYQIMPKTWDTVVQPALNLPDFSIESQEKAGRYLTQNRGVDPDKVITSYEEFEDVMNKLAPEWASLPYSKRSPTGYGSGSSYYGQGGISLPEAWKIYNQ